MLISRTAHAAPFMSAKGYSITPAPGWTINENGVAGSDVIFHTRSVGGFLPVFMVAISPAKPGESLIGHKAVIPKFYPKLFTHYQMVKMRDETINGLSALLVIATYQRVAMVASTNQQNTQRKFQRQDVVIRNGKVYTFTGLAPAALQSRYNPIFAQMIHSVRWSR